jgi:hypothetical protein
VQGQRTLAQGRDLAFGQASRTPRGRANPMGVVPRRALAGRAKSGTLPARCDPRMPWTFCRTLGVRRREEVFESVELEKFRGQIWTSR